MSAQGRCARLVPSRASARARVGRALILAGAATMLAPAGAQPRTAHDEGPATIAPEVEDAQLARARAWIEERLLAQRGASIEHADALAQEVDIRRGLKSAGLDPVLADALGDTLDPDEPISPKRMLRALETARVRLNGLIRARARSSPGPLSPSARVRLEKILEDPAFAEAANGPGLVARMALGIRQIMGRIFQKLADVAGRHPRALPWVVGLLLAGAAGVIALMLRRLFDPGRSARPASLVSYRGDATRPGSRAVDLLEQARHAGRIGRLLDALALSDMAALAALQRRGLLPAIAGLTDLEGVRWLSGPTHVRDASESTDSAEPRGGRGRHESSLPSGPAGATASDDFGDSVGHRDLPNRSAGAGARFARLVQICDGALYGGVPATEAAVKEGLDLAAALVEDASPPHPGASHEPGPDSGLMGPR